MDKIPIFAWLVLGVAAVIFFALNFGLWAEWKRRNHYSNKRGNPFQGVINNTPAFLKNPWHSEDEKWTTLNNTVTELKKTFRDDSS